MEKIKSITTTNERKKKQQHYITWAYEMRKKRPETIIQNKKKTIGEEAHLFQNGSRKKTMRMHWKPNET